MFKNSLELMKDLKIKDDKIYYFQVYEPERKKIFRNKIKGALGKADY